jgi:transcriptional regulator with XRE-family HTH domain
MVRNDNRVFARNLRMLRRGYGLTLDEVEARCGVGKSQINGMEHGKVSWQSSNAEKVCRVYGFGADRVGTQQVVEIELAFIDPDFHNEVRTIWWHSNVTGQTVPSRVEEWVYS